MCHVYAVIVRALINLQMMRRVRNLWRQHGRLFIMNDPTTLQHGVVVEGEDVAVYVQVADFGIQAAQDETANAVAKLIVEYSRATGLLATCKPAGTVDQFIGLRPVASLPAWTSALAKMGAVEQAI